MLPFALNHMTTPTLDWRAFADLAAGLGCVGVEYRNDLAAPLFGGDDPAVVGAALRAKGLRFLALAEVKMFNDWSDAKAAEAEALMKVAVAAGADHIVVGRPIWQAPDPRAAAEAILAEMASPQARRPNL